MSLFNRLRQSKFVQACKGGCSPRMWATSLYALLAATWSESIMYICTTRDDPFPFIGLFWGLAVQACNWMGLDKISPSTSSEYSIVICWACFRGLEYWTTFDPVQRVDYQILMAIQCLYFRRCWFICRGNIFKKPDHMRSWNLCKTKKLLRFIDHSASGA